MSSMPLVQTAAVPGCGPFHRLLFNESYTSLYWPEEHVGVVLSKHDLGDVSGEM